LTLPTLSVLAILLSILSPIAFTQATATPALVTCVNLETGTERISRSGKCRYTQEAQANWHKNQTDSPIALGASAKVITLCSNKESSPVSYHLIRAKCAKHQVTTVFSRSGALPTKPAITQVVSFGYDSSQISLAQNAETNPDAPIAFYTVASSKGNTQKVYFWRDLSLVISGLQAQTTYTFTVSATTADGTSPVSASSLPVTTPAYVPPTSTPASTAAPLAAPAFTLSAIAETKTVNTTATGFTISSTGGAIASFTINATPPGMGFNTSTGALTGTPNTVASATTYTVTATNASGTATQTFVLTVKAVVYSVGDTGPGGGTIVFTSTGGFACGPTLVDTCNYLELSTLLDRTLVWSIGSFASLKVPSPGADKTAIGTGYWNTLSIIAQNGTYDTSSNAYEAGASQAHRGGGFSDWYLPSKDELQAIYNYNSSLSSPFTWDRGYFYNSSSEFSATSIWGIYFAPGTSMVDGVGKTDNNFFFAVRSF
jgi:hypothetical protein